MGFRIVILLIDLLILITKTFKSLFPHILQTHYYGPIFLSVHEVK